MTSVDALADLEDRINAALSEGRVWRILSCAAEIEKHQPSARRDKLYVAVVTGLYEKGRPRPARELAIAALDTLRLPFARPALRRLLLCDPGFVPAREDLIGEARKLVADGGLSSHAGRSFLRKLTGAHGDSVRSAKRMNAAVLALTGAMPGAEAIRERHLVQTNGPTSIPAPETLNEINVTLGRAPERNLARPSLHALALEEVELRKRHSGLALLKNGKLQADLYNDTGLIETALGDWPDEVTEHKSRPAVLAIDIHPTPNYCHWLFDALARVVMLIDRFQLRPGEFDVIVESAPRFIVDSLAAIGVPQDRIIELGRTARAHFSRLLVSTSSFRRLRHPAQSGSTDLLCAVRDRILSGLAVASPTGHEEIFISRRDATKRRLVNELDFEEVLKPHGVRFIAPGELSFSDQVKLFAGTRVLMGVHGAGLANLLFLPPRATVVEIFPPRYGTASYYVTAMALGLRYVCMNGIGDGALSTFLPVAHYGKEDFIADPKLLLAFLTALRSPDCSASAIGSSKN